MRERERNGVRIGQPVRDLDGGSLGRVVRLYAWGFATRRGLPVLVGQDYVVRYDEVRAVRDGALVVARSRRDLLDLAAGGIPPSWRVQAPPGFPTAATPSEARDLRLELARGRVGPFAQGEAPEPPAPGAGSPLTDEEVRRHVDARGEGPIVPSDHG